MKRNSIDLLHKYIFFIIFIIMNKMYFEVFSENHFVVDMMRKYISGNNKFPAEVMPLVKEIDKIMDKITDATNFTSVAIKLTNNKTAEGLTLYLETF